MIDPKTGVMRGHGEGKALNESLRRVIDHVGGRRAAGLGMLEARMAEMREQSAREELASPPGWEEEYARWLRSVG